MNQRAYLGILAGGLLLLAGCLTVEPNRGNRTAPAVPPAPLREEPPVTTHHQIILAGKPLNYTATAGFLPIANDTGKVEAHIFYVAYTRDNESNLAARPLTFAFNGGPGASSVWLHLGTLGPKRAVLGADGMELPATPGLVDNEQTWLDFTDLVFIDPIGTGYSRTVDGVEAKPFWSLEKDIKVAAQFIRLYATKSERWLSPKFIAGESYGTTRAAGLASHLQTATGLNLDGVILISSALSFQMFSYDDGNDIAFALALPSYAAAAAYHKQASDDRATMAQWALSDYFAALAKGAALPEPERQRMVAQLAAWTGLSPDYLETNRLRVPAWRFAKELLRREDCIIGVMDARVVGRDLTPRGEQAHFDPAFFLATGPFVATLNDYLRRDLKFESNLPYVFISRDINQAWQWFEHGQGYVSVADDLAAAMNRDPSFRVFAAAGIYDLVTPYLGQKYTFDHLELDASRRANLIFQTYPAGHQIYTDPVSRQKLKTDVAAFVTKKSQS